MRRKILFIVNPASGKHALEGWRRFAREGEKAGLAFEQALTRAPGHAEQLALQDARGRECVVAAGGDGTVLEVLNGLLATQGAIPALCILPLGTGNDTARAFGIHDSADTFAALSEGQAYAADLIRIDCHSPRGPLSRYAALFASVGITSELLRRATPSLKRICGRRLTYPAALLLALRTYPAPLMRITSGTLSVQDRFIFVSASNGETFGGGIRVAPGARTDDGLLNLNLIRDLSRWEALRNLLRLHQGRHITHPKVTYQLAQQVEINTDTPIEVAADGDLVGWTPARFSVQPKAVRILIPHGDRRR